MINADFKGNIDITLKNKERIELFEMNRRNARPWIFE